MTSSIQHILAILVEAIEIISTCILLIGFLKALLGFFKTEWYLVSNKGGPEGLSKVRRQLGTYILLGLDFYIVSDIIHSMIQPALNELLNLALIVVLRTTIGYFLSKEIAELSGKSPHTEASKMIENKSTFTTAHPQPSGLS